MVPQALHAPSSSNTANLRLIFRQLGPVSASMVDSYCEGFADIFGLIAYSGILSARDSECFRLQMETKSGFFVLFVASVVVASLNGVVLCAMNHYLHDTKESNLIAADDEEESVDDVQLPAIRGAIEPDPVLFTDYFRWLLIEDTSG